MTIALPEIPGYQLDREIGAGGMARVYLGTQISLDRKVALKVMAPALVADPAFSKRFLREARTLAGLTHPNIVAVYDVGATESQLHYFAMQHLDNGDLAARIARGVPEPDLVRVITAIAKALGFAHQRGVVHRDVTPGNIMFDSANNPVLTDFGIARSQHGSTRITHTGVSIGTSSYMSPEQARGGEVDQRSDLYSLGALTFEGLTGHPPYQGADGFAVAYAHVFEPIPRLPAHVSHWQSFIDKVLAKDPNERFDNADQFAMALSDVPVSANRIVPQRNVAKATLAMPLTSAGTDPNASTRALPNQDPRALAPIKKNLNAPAPAGEKERALALKTAASIAAAVNKPETKRAFWPIALAVALALGAGVGGWYWTHKKPTVAGSGDSTPEVALVPETPVVKVSTDKAPTTAPPEAADPVAISVDPTAPVSPELTPSDLPTDQDPALPVTTPLGNAFGPPTRAMYVKPWLDMGVSQAKKNLCFAARGGAVDYFRLALSIDVGNVLASTGVADCFATLTPKVDTFLASESADLTALLPELAVMQKSAGVAGPKSKEFLLLQNERARLITALLARAPPLEEKWQGTEAAKYYQAVLALDANNASAKAGVVSAPAIGRPGYRFTDTLSSGGKAPTLVVIGAGDVTMRDAKGGTARVKISENFAVARSETTYGEFLRFVKATNYRGSGKGCNNKEGFAMFVAKDRTWDKPGFAQTDRSPVVCVDFDDAQAYVRWLSKQTSENYQLLSEAQWQLLAKNAPAPSCQSGNMGDADYGKEFEERDFYKCSDGHAGTASVGSFGADRNSLFDLTGNVREWVADCWNAAIGAHPGNGAPWQAGRCNARVVMGTAWLSAPDESTVSVRTNVDRDARNNTVGFRIARTVPQIP
jgi:serine/threonine-protein kinase PpkA